MSVGFRIELPWLVVLGVGLVTLLGAFFFRRNKHLYAEYAQSLYKDVAIETIFIHPIKSCRGSSVKEARYGSAGLIYDRTWLIIDAQTKKFQTARELPRMVVISPKIDQEKGILEIHIPLHEKGQSSTAVVTTPLDPTKEDLQKMQIISGITIWNSTVDGYAVSSEADKVLSEFFGKPVQLVRKGPMQRNAGPDDPRGKNSEMQFQDFYPILIASKASIQHVRDVLVASVYPHMSSKNDIMGFKVSDKVDLNRWTPEELESLPIERFRPNIVMKSVNNEKPLIPWEEDAWTRVVVSKQPGEVAGIFNCVARCGRCMVPNVDPQEGTRDAFIPYTVMQKFRKVQPEYARIGKPCFGILASPQHRASGMIRVGDRVQITNVMNPDKRKLGK